MAKTSPIEHLLIVGSGSPSSVTNVFCKYIEEVVEPSDLLGCEKDFERLVKQTGGENKAVCTILRMVVGMNRYAENRRKARRCDTT